MHRAQLSARFAWIEGERTERLASFAECVEAGLSAPQRSLPCRFFYDDQGSALFEQICELPEYYLTRSEHEILERHAGEIASRCPSPLTLVELGSGSSAKTRLLIEAFLSRQRTLRYVPVDISPTMLEVAARSLLSDYPRLEIVAIAREYREGLRLVGKETGGPKLIAWLGSNIGNFTRPGAAAFLAGIRDAMGPEDRVLLGADLRKDAPVLESAYDDAQGVTARFNKNLLARVNRELGGEFDLDDWDHRARVVDGGARVEIGLVCRRDTAVWIGALGRSYRFAAGEFLHTEDSAKYSEAEIAELARRASLALETRWFDQAERFSVNLLAPR